MKYITQIILLLFISSCSLSLENKISDLVENKNKWMKSAPNRSYTYVYKKYCFCGLNDKEITVQVKKGVVTSVSLKSGEKRRTKYIKTIKQYFEEILETLKKEEQEENIVINIKYNKLFGYPSVIDIKRNDVMDANIKTIISKVVIH